MKQFRLIISGGGTGGHIYPALAIAKGLRKKYSDINILFVGAIGKMEMEKVPKEGFKIIGLWISGFKRSLSIQNLLFPIKTIFSIIHSLRILKKYKPDIVIGTGGFASGPILKVAQLLGLPTLIQEQNSYPGVTNRILSKNANRICVAYQGLERYFPKKNIIITGNPIREKLTKIKIGSKAKLLFGLNPKMKTLVIIGGSLGSKRINQLIEKQKEFILKSGIQILWQCGSLYYSQYKNLESKEIVIRPYFDKMENVYAAADFIISRAGAVSISELSCVGKPLILIPSPNVTANHQLKNAKALSKANAAIMIRESELDKEFNKKFSLLISNISKQKQLKDNLKKFAKPFATDDIINQIIELK